MAFDISLIIFLIFVAFSAWNGYRKGAVRILGKLVGLVSGYIAAFSYIKPASAWVQAHTAFDGLLSYAVAGMAVFIIASSTTYFIFGLLQKLLSASNESADKKAQSGWGGALLGAGLGMVIGGVLVWGYTLFSGLLATKGQMAIPQPSAFQRQVNQLVGDGIKKAVKVSTGSEEAASTAAVLLVSPAENIEKFNRIMHKGEVQALLSNPQARRALDKRDASALLRNESFKRLTSDPDFYELASNLGLNQPGGELAENLANKFTQVWAQINQVKDDPEFINLMQDPEVQELMQSRNIYGMLNSPKVEALLAKVTSTKTAPITPANTSANPQLEPGQPAKPKEIYRWVDEKGQVHYSDEKPAEQESQQD